jgi:hypothetical protein
MYMQICYPSPILKNANPMLFAYGGIRLIRAREQMTKENTFIWLQLLTTLFPRKELDIDPSRGRCLKLDFI